MKITTCVLTKLYWKNNNVKCEIALGVGKNKEINVKILKNVTGKEIKQEFLKIKINN